MRFIDLNPKYAEVKGERTSIVFDAPNCEHEDKCKIVIPFAGEGTKWGKVGDDFESMSLTPSIWFNKGKSNPASCDVHFFVTNGEIKIV